jgi:hypothetical protein
VYIFMKTRSHLHMQAPRWFFHFARGMFDCVCCKLCEFICPHLIDIWEFFGKLSTKLDIFTLFCCFKFKNENLFKPSLEWKEELKWIWISRKKRKINWIKVHRVCECSRKAESSPRKWANRNEADEKRHDTTQRLKGDISSWNWNTYELVTLLVGNFIPLESELIYWRKIATNSASCHNALAHMNDLEVVENCELINFKLSRHLNAHSLYLYLTHTMQSVTGRNN